MMVVVPCAICERIFEVFEGLHGYANKKVDFTNCCNAPVCKYCSKGCCVFCKIETKIETKRKTSFSNWGLYYGLLSNLNLSMEEMPFMFWWLKATPNKMQWETMQTPGPKASYNAYVGKIMLLHISARFQSFYLDKMGMGRPNLRILNVRKDSRIAGHYVSINQSLPKNKNYRFPRRKAINQALVGFITMIVMRMAFVPINWTHDDDSVEVVYKMNTKMISLILRRFLSLK